MIEVEPGKYRHYKGDEVEVLFTAYDAEDHKRTVVYRASDGLVWVRHLESFIETVTQGGKQVRRFEKLPY